MRKSAVISDCGQFRYILRRSWDIARPALGFIMLNGLTEAETSASASVAGLSGAAPTSAARLDAGPWAVTETGNVISADFKHDVVLGISGDFANKAERMAYGRWLADTLNAAPTSASTVPAGFWLAPMEPDEEMWTEGRDPIMYRDLGDYRPASLDVPAWQREPDGSVNHDKSKGTAAVRVWRAMRDSYLARNPGACSVTDGEAKK